MKIAPQLAFLVRAIEFILALFVLAGVVASAGSSVQILLAKDWSSTAAFYELIYLVLLLVIGVELVKMLVVRDLLAVLELLAFVVARKMLKPELGSLDILLVVMAFVALMWARRHLVLPQRKPDDETSNWDVFGRES